MIMRKLTLAMALVTITAASSFAQYSKVSLNLLGGYTFDEKVYFDAATATVKGAFQYGGSLEFFPSRNKSVEISYQRMGTTIPLYGPTGTQYNKGNDDGSVNYILLNGINYFAKSNDAKALPFFGGGIGVGILNGAGSSATKFAWDLKGGVKVKTSSVVSFKLQAYLQSIISTFGSDYWYAGGGVVYSVPDYASMFQFGLGAAICIDFPSK